MSAALLLLLASLAFLAYAYVGFPMLVALVGTLRPRPVRKAEITPTVSLIIAAYNEEDAIAARLDNALQSDYPASCLEIIVASDGSTDATNRIVESYADRGVKLLTLPRRGKIHALDSAVGAASGDILVFSDANTMCETATLRLLVRSFADPAVGGVAGHTGYKVDRGSESSGLGERSYWTYDTWLKVLESRTGSIVSAHGGLYAIRRGLYQRSPDSAVTDDFALSTAVIAQGRRLVFEPEARAWESTVTQAQREFGRRVRLMTRGLRGVLMRRALLNPVRHGFYAVVLASHKLIRRLAPLALIACLVASLLLARQGPVYQLFALLQLTFYGMAIGGGLLRRTRLGRFRGLYMPFYFVMANAACLVALFEVCRGRRIEQWEPQRHAPAPVRHG